MTKNKSKTNFLYFTHTRQNFGIESLNRNSGGHAELCIIIIEVWNRISILKIIKSFHKA